MERICQRYHVLPSQVLEEKWEWIEYMLLIMGYDNERIKLEERRNAYKNGN